MGSERVKKRWEMPFEELALNLAHGRPGSFDFQEAVAVIHARTAYEAHRSSEETRKLRRATMFLAGAIVVMALGTLALAVAAFLGLQ